MVAEGGVETKQEVDTLIACGIDMLQGFALGKPMPADKIASCVFAKSGLMSKDLGVKSAIYEGAHRATR